MEIINDYKLGIMWATGTLAKGTDRYVLQVTKINYTFWKNYLRLINPKL